MIHVQLGKVYSGIKEIVEKNLKTVTIVLNLIDVDTARNLLTETPSMDVVALLANIGGTMGLFLGMSLLHVCELAEVFIELVDLSYSLKVILISFIHRV
jgi:hypothetical protein